MTLTTRRRISNWLSRNCRSATSSHLGGTTSVCAPGSCVDRGGAFAPLKYESANTRRLPSLGRRSNTDQVHEGQHLGTPDADGGTRLLVITGQRGLSVCSLCTKQHRGCRSSAWPKAEVLRTRIEVL